MKTLYKKSFLWLSLCGMLLVLFGCSGGGATNASSQKEITAYSLNGIAGTISSHNISVRIPVETDKTKLKVEFKTTGVSVKAGEKTLVSGETLLDFTKPVLHTVIALDGSTATYTVKVDTGELFSCVADGENPCGCLVQNDGSGLMWYGNALNNDGNGYTFNQESLILLAFNSGSGHCGYTNWRIPTLNTLDNNNYYFGAVNNKINGTTDFGLLGNYAIANGYLSQGNLNIWLNAQGFKTNATSSYWASSVYAPYPNSGAWLLENNGYVIAVASQKGDTHSLLPIVTLPALILSYSLNGTAGTINGESITVTMPYDTNVESLVATFTTNVGRVQVESTLQTSGTTPNNFTSPVVYTLTRADGSTYTYTVTATVMVAPLFICINDPVTSNACGCLLENDGSGLTWYADGSQTGTWTNWCSHTGSAADPNCSSNGSSLVAFNGVNHCGYSDWHLPTAPDVVLGYYFVDQVGGNWGTLGTYAKNNGWIEGNAFNTWLNTTSDTNHFTNVTNNLYWSSLFGYDSSSGPLAWVVDMSTSTVLELGGAPGGVLLVRSGP